MPLNYARLSPYGEEVECPRRDYSEVDQGSEPPTNQNEGDREPRLQAHGIQRSLQPGVVAAEQRREVALLACDVDEPRRRERRTFTDRISDLSSVCIRRTTDRSARQSMRRRPSQRRRRRLRVRTEHGRSPSRRYY